MVFTEIKKLSANNIPMKLMEAEWKEHKDCQFRQDRTGHSTTEKLEQGFTYTYTRVQGFTVFFFHTKIRSEREGVITAYTCRNCTIFKRRIADGRTHAGDTYAF